MFKKFFAAVILVVFVMCSQIAFAELPIDWNKVKQISSKSELRNYLERINVTGQTIIPVVLTNGFTLSVKDLLNLSSSFQLQAEVKGQDARTTLLLLKIREYPGTRVANAYLSGDTSWLTQDELKLYNVAVGIVNKIKQNKSNRGLEDQAMSIYQEIMNRVTYVSGDDMSHQPRFVTAIGALVDGKANCQGYTDAFYMLGKMCGLNVGRMSGTAGGGSHMWNTVTSGDGKSYFIDVTWGDSHLQKSKDGKRADSYIYFYAPVEIMQVTHQWDRSLEPPNLQPSVDFRYSYSEWWTGNLARATSAEAGLKLLAEELNDGKHTWFSVMTPYDERFDHEHVQQVINYLNKIIHKKYYVYVYRYGRFIFFSVYLR